MSQIDSVGLPDPRAVRPAQSGAADVGPRPPPALAAGSAQEDLSIRLSRFMESSRCRLLAGDGRKSPLAR